jgi:integrase
MTDFSLAADDYLVTRRTMGYKLCEQGRLLRQFIAYLEDQGAEHLTMADAVSWAMRPPGGAMTWWAFRLGVVRAFARYLSTLDPVTEVPPAGLFPEPSHRIVPYIYSDDDLERVLDAAGRLTPEHRADTYRTLISLVAVTGMRVGEAVRLDRGDVDLHEALLTIRNSNPDIAAGRVEHRFWTDQPALTLQECSDSHDEANDLTDRSCEARENVVEDDLGHGFAAPVSRLEGAVRSSGEAG